MKAKLDEIFARELKRIDALSLKGPLEMEELKKLELLVRSLKQYEEPTKNEVSVLSQLSSEELLAFIKGEDVSVKANPQPEPLT